MYKRASRFFQNFLERNGFDLRGRSVRKKSRPPRPFRRAKAATTRVVPAKSAEVETKKDHTEGGEFRATLASNGKASQVLAALKNRLSRNANTSAQSKAVGMLPDRQRDDDAKASVERKRKIELSEEDRQLLDRHLSFYQDLAQGNRVPTTDAQRHFVDVTRGVAVAQTDHERAYMKFRRLKAAEGRKLEEASDIGDRSPREEWVTREGHRQIWRQYDGSKPRAN